MAEQSIIAIDLGGTRTRAAFVDGTGRVTRKVDVETLAQGGTDGILDQLTGLVEGIAAQVGGDDICGVGLCAPGPLDADTGVVLATPTVRGFQDFPLRQKLQDRLKWTVTLENDALAATFGEWRLGAGQGCDNLLYLTLSTGIGGGAVVDGHLQRGRRGMAGHFGHMALTDSGPLCPCGNVGCWEALASGTALARRADALGFATARDLCDAARAGDAAANGAIGETGRWLGIGIVNLLHLFSPSRIIVGGGLAGNFDLLRPHVEAHVARRAMVPFRDVTIVGAALGDNAGLVGMAAKLLPQPQYLSWVEPVI